MRFSRGKYQNTVVSKFTLDSEEQLSYQKEEYLLKTIDQVIKELGLKWNYQIKLVKEIVSSDSKVIQGRFYKQDRLIQINLWAHPNIRDNSFLITLVHELRHAWQYENECLEPSEETDIYNEDEDIKYIFAWQEIDARKYSYWYVYDRNTKYREPIKITSKDVIWQVNHKGNRISDDYLFYKLLTYNEIQSVIGYIRNFNESDDYLENCLQKYVNLNDEEIELCRQQAPILEVW